jgi:hypothetical protein
VNAQRCRKFTSPQRGESLPGLDPGSPAHFARAGGGTGPIEIHLPLTTPLPARAGRGSRLSMRRVLSATSSRLALVARASPLLHCASRPLLKHKAQDRRVEACG